MSKSFKNSNDKNNKHDWNDDEEYMFNNKSNFKERRQKRRLVNAIRSKNIQSLIELEDDED